MSGVPDLLCYARFTDTHACPQAERLRPTESSQAPAADENVIEVSEWNPVDMI
jgi:hypothetical protein